MQADAHIPPTPTPTSTPNPESFTEEQQESLGYFPPVVRQLIFHLKKFAGS